jgi:mannose-6-phosphate isomerase-like protein (cupin superfamily)
MIVFGAHTPCASDSRCRSSIQKGGATVLHRGSPFIATEITMSCPNSVRGLSRRSHAHPAALVMSQIDGDASTRDERKRLRWSLKGARELDEKVNLAEKLAGFEEHWKPRIAGMLNDYKVMLVKVQGDFVWHKHDETDDFFLVIKGHLTIQLRDRNVELDEGEMFIVPRGVEHCPRADDEAWVLLIEPAQTVNTGDAGGPLTAELRWA